MQLGGAGADNTSALAIGGSGALTNTETWNGTSWTEVNNLNSGRSTMGAAGIITSAICAGGNTPDTVNVETWNGTNWTEVQI